MPPNLPVLRVEARALLFDMDGTLLLSHAIVERGLRLWAARHGLDAGRLIDAARGCRVIDTVRQFCPPGFDPEEEAAFLDRDERADTDGIVAVDGILPLLAGLPPDRWAIVTSADRELMELRLRAVGSAPPPVVVTAEQVGRGKPDPEGYLLAARRLGVDPAETIVFEDAPAGVSAGLAAGARVVVVGPHGGVVPVTARIADFTVLEVVASGSGLDVSIAGRAASASRLFP